MLEFDRSTNRPIKFGCTCISSGLFCAIVKKSVLYLLSFSTYWQNNCMVGLFGWKIYCDTSIMRSPGIPDVEAFDQSVALDPGTA